MPYCPECHDEFQDWVKICPDCKVDLVEQLPTTPKPEYNDEPLIHITTAPNEAIAGMWEGILNEHNIPALLKSYNLKAATYSLLSNQFQKIYVLKSDAPEAKRLLQPFEHNLKAYAHSKRSQLPIISRILLVITTVAPLVDMWSAYLLGTIIIYISKKVRR